MLNKSNGEVTGGFCAPSFFLLKEAGFSFLPPNLLSRQFYDKKARLEATSLEQE